MIDNELQVRLLHAAKTQDQWKAVTSYPKKGEVCLEAINTSGATAFKIKIGDGTRPYCRNTGTAQDPVWDFTSDQVLPYFGSVIETSGSVGIVAISTYDTTKKKLSFYNLSLTATTSGGSTTLTPTIEVTPYLEVIEGDGISFTTDETGTVKEFYINVSAVGGNKIDVTTNSGNVVITHEDIDTTATDVASTITTDGSSTVDEKELNVITGIKVDAQGHITHIDKDKSTNLVAADLRGSVSVTDDSAWIYRPTGGTISIGEDVAKVLGMEGNSCVWNQLMQNGECIPSSYPSGARLTFATIDFDTNEMFVTNISPSSYGGLQILNATEINKGHIYVFMFDVKQKTSNSQYRVTNSNVSGTSYDAPENWQRHKQIISNTANSTGIYLYVATPSYQIYFRNIEIFDLTNIFGSGNEPSTVAKFEAWLSEHVGTKPYYAYNPGEILSSKTLGFNTYCQNLLNPTTKKARLVTYTDTTNSNKYTIKNIPDETTITYTPDNTGTAVDITSSITNNTFDITSYGNGIIEFSAISDDTYVCIKWDGSKDDDIVSYEEHNYSFDITKVYGRVSGAGEYVQCFPNGMKSARTAHDTLTAAGATKVIGDVNLGTLNWNRQPIAGQRYGFAVAKYDMKYATSGVPNIVCGKYRSNSLNALYPSTATDSGVTTATNGPSIIVFDDSYSDASTFKTSISGVMLNYELATPITYTDLIYSEDGGQTGTPFKKVLLTMNVSDFGTEEQVLPDYVNNNPVAVPANVVIEYKSNFKEAVLETIDKVNSYKNPVRGTNDTSQTTGKVAVYDSDSTVKSSTFEISNAAIDAEGTSNETTVPTVDAIVDYIDDVIDTEVTVTDITTTDDDVSGNGGIRVTNSNKVYDVHHANITQSDTTYSTTSNELVANIVTSVTVDDFGHVKGKEVISSDKLIAADIKAPVTVTDDNMWSFRTTAKDVTIVGEDSAYIDILKGKTLKWQQLVQNGNFADGTTGWTIQNSTITVNNGEATIVRGQDRVSGYGLFIDVSTIVKTRHKYYIHCQAKITEDNSIAIIGFFTNTFAGGGAGGSKSTTSTSFTNVSTILEGTNTTAYFGIKPGFISSAENATAVFKNVLLFDLTEMGLDSITSPEEFEALYPLDYYNYTSTPVLINNAASGIKTTGFNQWDGTFSETNVYLTNENSRTANSNYNISSYIRVFGNTDYYIKDIIPSLETNPALCWYDINKNFISGLRNGGGTNNIYNKVLTSPSNAAYLRCSINKANTSIACINLSWSGYRNGEYEPYEQHTLYFNGENGSLATLTGKLLVEGEPTGESVTIFPEGMKSAGSVYDFGKADSDGYIRKVTKKISNVAKLTEVGIEAISTEHGFASVTASSAINGAVLASGYTSCTNQNSVSNLITYCNNNSISKGVCVSSNQWGKIYIYDSSIVTTSEFNSANANNYVIYELSKPEEYLLDTPIPANYIVNDFGTEQRLSDGVNSTTGTPLSTPFTGIINYKSNFKDSVIQLIEKVNNYKNPVQGANNTLQTVGKLAVYDTNHTVASSTYSASNATIVEGATGNNVILPSVEALITYVNTKLSSALTYKGTIDEWSDLPTSGQSVGDMYIASAQFTEQGTTYNAGDFFIWNGSSWDIVSGTTNVINGDVTLAMDGSEYTLGTIDGVDITVTTPNLDFSDPTANGNSLSYIDTISQTDGLISATKKTIPDASTSQKGVVELSNGIESTTSGSTDVPTDYDTLTNLNLRDVGVGILTNNIGTLTKRVYDDDSTSQTYETWISKTFYPTTKLAAIDSFSTDFSTAYPDLAAIEALGSSSPTSGFPKRASDGTWTLTEDTGKMKWLDEVTNTYTYSAASTNDEELGSYIHNYTGVTTIDKATVTNDSNKYGFRIDIPILTSASATVGKVLKGLKDTGVTSLPTWGYLSIEELYELDSLSSTEGFLQRTYNSVTSTSSWSLGYPNIQNIGSTEDNAAGTTGKGYLKRVVVTPQSGSTPAVYDWEFDPYGGGSFKPSYANDSYVEASEDRSTQPSAPNAGLKEQTGTSTYKHYKIPFSAIENDPSTGNNAVVIILNGNFS